MRKIICYGCRRHDPDFSWRWRGTVSAPCPLHYGPVDRTEEKIRSKLK